MIKEIFRKSQHDRDFAFIYWGFPNTMRSNNNNSGCIGVDLKTTKLILLGVVSLLFPITTFAQPGSRAPATSQNTDVKLAEIQRTTLSPTLDGVLDDPVWQQATQISDLHQIQPVDHGEPSQRSTYYITYDENYFYMAARLYDSDPEQIRARQLVQGQNIFSDDTVDILLDTFNNDRTAFYFSTNPNGIRNEGVWESASAFNSDWSGIWDVQARVDEEGWTAEFAIPFTTLNFDPNTEEWGLNLGRTIARTNERIYWSSFNRSTNPATAGQIRGISDIRQGLGLDIVPSITVAQVEDHLSGDTEDRIDPSLDVFYKFTPNLTGVLTFNTDFSATEVDNRQVNLTRFSLFFPEKRDFFLQDSEIFSFGSIGGGGGFGGGGPGGGGGGFGPDRNGIPFYSRRIGLDPRSGQPVDIDAGAKVAGRVGNFSLGALAVQQGDRPGLGGQQVFVGRITSNILSESKIGAIMTQGDPNSETDNSLFGLDFSYRNTRFLESHSLTSDIWYQQTDTEGKDGDDKAYAMDINLNTQGTGLSGSIDYSYIGEDYNPALGFANRKGIEKAGAFANFRYFLRGHPQIRTIMGLVNMSHTRDNETGAMQSESVTFSPFGINTHRGDRAFFNVQREREGLDAPFEIRDGIIIPEGKYSFTSLFLNIGGSNQRNIAPSLGIRTGDFYDGTRNMVNAGVEWRPNRNVSIDFSYNFTDVSLPQGDFIARLISLNANYAMNSEWSWINLLQYDNDSDAMGINSRLRWNPSAGENFYFVVNYNFDSSFGAFERLSTTDSEFVLKYTKNFRF